MFKMWTDRQQEWQSV